MNSFYFGIIISFTLSCSIGGSSDKFDDPSVDSLLVDLEFKETDYKLRHGASLYNVSSTRIGDTLVAVYILDVQKRGEIKSNLNLTSNNNFEIRVDNDTNSRISTVNRGVYEFIFYIKDKEGRIIQEFLYEER